MKKLIILLTLFAFGATAQEQKKYTFTEQELNEIVMVLGKVEYEKVYPVIDYIKYKVASDTTNIKPKTKAK